MITVQQTKALLTAVLLGVGGGWQAAEADDTDIVHEAFCPGSSSWMCPGWDTWLHMTSGGGHGPIWASGDQNEKDDPEEVAIENDYLDRWCSEDPPGDSGPYDTQGFVEIWYPLQASSDAWDEGWGWNAPCIQQYPFARFMNAASALHKVSETTQYRRPLQLSAACPSDDCHNSYNYEGRWFDFVTDLQVDGWEPAGTWDGNASNPSNLFGINNEIELKLRFFYRSSPIVRAGVMVHEATHEDVPHISDDACESGESCDPIYGFYNANTMQINFLYDAAFAYHVVDAPGYPLGVHKWWDDDEAIGVYRCGHMPVLSQRERTEALHDAKWRLYDRFQYPSIPYELYPTINADEPFLFASQVDDHEGAVWQCDDCDLDVFLFQPETFGTAGNKACNEALQPANVEVNKANQLKCIGFNQVLHTNNPDEFLSEEDVAGLWDQFWTSLESCKEPTGETLDAYCVDHMKDANHVDGIDPYGFLADHSFHAESECYQRFCHVNFDPAWAAHANEWEEVYDDLNPQFDAFDGLPRTEESFNDPLGCMDVLCAGDAFCRRMYLAWHGNPDMYIPHYQDNPCKKEWLRCYERNDIVWPLWINPSQLDDILLTGPPQWESSMLANPFLEESAETELAAVWASPSPDIVQAMAEWIQEQSNEADIQPVNLSPQGLCDAQYYSCVTQTCQNFGKLHGVLEFGAKLNADARANPSPSGIRLVKGVVDALERVSAEVEKGVSCSAQTYRTVESILQYPEAVRWIRDAQTFYDRILRRSPTVPSR